MKPQPRVASHPDSIKASKLVVLCHFALTLPDRFRPMAEWHEHCANEWVGRTRPQLSICRWMATHAPLFPIAHRRWLCPALKRTSCRGFHKKRISGCSCPVWRKAAIPVSTASSGHVQHRTTRHARWSCDGCKSLRPQLWHVMKVLQLRSSTSWPIPQPWAHQTKFGSWERAFCNRKVSSCSASAVELSLATSARESSAAQVGHRMAADCPLLWISVLMVCFIQLLQMSRTCWQASVIRPGKALKPLSSLQMMHSLVTFRRFTSPSSMAKYTSRWKTRCAHWLSGNQYGNEKSHFQYFQWEIIYEILWSICKISVNQR